MFADTPDHTHAKHFVSDRAAGLWLSGIKEMAMLSARIDDAVSLAWGVPSFATPEYITNGVIEQLKSDADIGKYALPDGLDELKQLVARKHKVDTGISVDTDKHVMISAGNMQGMHSLLQVITNPGDEIILTDPCFASHIQQVNICGGKPVYWSLDESNSWSLDIDGLSGLISEKTKAIIINSPSNPTGKIFSRENLLRIGEMAKSYNFMILIDDPYSLFTYEHKDKYLRALADFDNFRNGFSMYFITSAVVELTK